MQIIVDKRPQIYQVDRATGMTQSIVGGVVALASIAALMLPIVLSAVKSNKDKKKEV